MFAWQLGLFGRWLVDDALISFAYARSLSEGAGYAQTAGEVPVEGASNPLWTVLLALLRVVGVFDRGHTFGGIEDYVFVIRLLALVCFMFVQLILAFALERAFPRWGPALGLVAALSAALSAPFVVWSVSGLENPLYALSLAALVGITTTHAGRDTVSSLRTARWAAFWALAAAVTRPDGALFLILYTVVVLISGRAAGRLNRRRSLLAYAVLVAVPYGAFIAWRRFTFGLWVPNTAVAKRQGIDPAMIVGHLVQVPQVLGWPMFAVTAALTALALVVGSNRRAVVCTATSVVLATVVYAVLDTDWMPEFRFGTPLVVTVGALLALATGTIMARLRVHLGQGGRGRVQAVALVVGVASCLVFNGATMIPRTMAIASDPTIPGCWIANRFGRVFNFYADGLNVESGSLLAPDLGGTLMTSRLRIMDLAGLTEPRIAQYRARRDFQGLRDYVMDELQPTFIHLDKAWKAGLDKDPRLLSRYTELGSSDDWVRTDAIPDDVDLVLLRADGAALATQVRAERDQNPRRGCGALTTGDPVPAWTASELLIAGR